MHTPRIRTDKVRKRTRTDQSRKEVKEAAAQIGETSILSDLTRSRGKPMNRLLKVGREPLSLQLLEKDLL